MIKKLLLTICLFVSSHAVDNLTAQKQNALYIQNLIEIEESIAKNFEKYILTEFKIPTLDNLIDDSYLGSNFSTSNIMGSDIGFEDRTNLKIKYAITKNAYRKKAGSANSENYMVQLYNRDLYRDFTSVYYDSSTISNSYVQIILQSDEAKTIYDLLKDGSNTVEKECTSASVSTYCNNKNNKKTIRWYNSSSKWIEYDKAKFNKGDISTSMTVDELQSEGKISDLAVGSYIFISSERYVKLVDDTSSGTAVIQILKVD